MNDFIEKVFLEDPSKRFGFVEELDRVGTNTLSSYFSRTRYPAVFFFAMMILLYCTAVWLHRRDRRPLPALRIFGWAFGLWLGYLFFQLPISFVYAGEQVYCWQRYREVRLPGIVLQLPYLWPILLQDVFPWIALAASFLPLRVCRQETGVGGKEGKTPCT